MGSVNRVLILGHLGSDPELRYTAGGQAVANFNVATTEAWTKDGAKQERTEWHRIVVWGKQAESCGQYLKKGRQAHIEGKLQTREWEDKNGQKRYTTEIIAERVTFIGGGRDDGARDEGRGSERSRGDDRGGARSSAQKVVDDGWASGKPLEDDDCPF